MSGHWVWISDSGTPMLHSLISYNFTSDKHMMSKVHHLRLLISTLISRQYVITNEITKFSALGYISLGVISINSIFN